MSEYKIAHISAPIEFGGAEKVSLTLFRYANRDRMRIYPILLVRPWEEDGFFVRELQKEGYSFAKVPVAIKPVSQGRDYFRLIRCAMLIYAELKKGNFDIVHTHGYFADVIGVISAKMLNIPIVSTCHGFISTDIKLSIYNALDIIALRFMDQVITVSGKLKTDLTKKGIKETKIQVVQNAVAVISDVQTLRQQRLMVRKKYGIKADEVVLGFVGRLSVEKGIKYLIESGRGLVMAGVRIRILIIGGGPQRKEIEKLVEEHDLRGNVIFAGFQNDVSGILPAFDIFVLPSLTEGTSMALLEAMACGLPVIATSVGGTPKVVLSGINGILIPPRSSEAIVQVVMQLAKNGHLRKKIGRAAVRTVESEFGIEGWLRKIDNIYSNLIC